VAPREELRMLTPQRLADARELASECLAVCGSQEPIVRGA
jgi:hypothetical protein